MSDPTPHGHTSEDSGGWFCVECGMPHDSPLPCEGRAPYLEDYHLRVAALVMRTAATLLRCEALPYNRETIMRIVEGFENYTSPRRCRWRAAQYRARGTTD